MSYDFIKQVFCHQIGRKSSGDRATIVEFSAIGVGQRLGLICEKRPDRSGIRSRTRAPFSPSQTGSSVHSPCRAKKQFRALNHDT